MKSKFTTLAEQVLAGSVSGSSPEGRACVKKFLSLLINEYAYIDKSQANSILKQYDQDPKSLGEQMTQMFDEIGLNENSINDIDLFEDDGAEEVSFKKAEKWARCFDTIAKETGVNMEDLGFPDSYTFMEYVSVYM
jgi:hypothetical protein